MYTMNWFDDTIFFRHFFIHSYKLYIRFEEEKLTKRMLLIEFSVQTFTSSTQLELHYGIVLIGQWAFRQSLMKNHIFYSEKPFSSSSFSFSIRYFSRASFFSVLSQTTLKSYGSWNFFISVQILFEWRK